MATTPAAAQDEAQAAIDELKTTPENHPLYPARALRAIALTAAAIAAQNEARDAAPAKRTPRSTKPSSSSASPSKDLA